MATAPQTRKLYNDEVTLHFNPKARNRYQLADGTAPVGVTTVLSKVLAKEALMFWPMNMAIGWLKENCSSLTIDGNETVRVVNDSMFEEASKAHTRKSDKGKDVGTEVHDAIEKYLATGEVTEFPLEILSTGARVKSAAQKAFESFQKWFESVKPKVLATEQIVYSREHGYAGTFDALLEIDGKIVLCDVKTSNASRTSPTGIYPEYFLQLGAYSKAYHEEKTRWFGEETYEEEPGIVVHKKATSFRLDNPVSDLMVINASKQGTLSTLRASELGLSVADCERSWLQVLGLYRFLEPLKKVLKERTT